MGKKFNRWLMKKMGNLYVKLDHTLEYEKGPILSLDIDEDFENMSRYELCSHIEDKFLLTRDSFWHLDSTQKIRWCCQVAREMQATIKKKNGVEE